MKLKGWGGIELYFSYEITIWNLIQNAGNLGVDNL